MNEAAIALLLDRLPEHEARALLAGLEVPARVRQEFERIASTRYARALMANDLCRRAIVDKVAGRYDISQRTAYRRIDAAIEMGRPDLCQ